MDSHGIARVPWYLGSQLHSRSLCRLRGSHALRPAFPYGSTSSIVSSVLVPCSSQPWSLYPHITTPAGFNMIQVWAPSRSLAAT